MSFGNNCDKWFFLVDVSAPHNRISSGWNHLTHESTFLIHANRRHKSSDSWTSHITFFDQQSMIEEPFLVYCVLLFCILCIVHFHESSLFRFHRPRFGDRNSFECSGFTLRSSSPSLWVRVSGPPSPLPTHSMPSPCCPAFIWIRHSMTECDKVNLMGGGGECTGGGVRGGNWCL